MRPPRSACALLGLWVTVCGAAGAVVAVARPTPAAAQVRIPVPNPCNLPLVGAVCAVPRAIVGVPGAVADAADAVAALPGDLARSAIEGFANWIAAGAANFLESAGKAILTGTRPDLSGTGEGGRSWFREGYRDMALVALGLFAPMMMLAVLHGVLTGSAALLWRAVANLPVAAVGTAAAVVVVEALLAATDSASSFVAAGLGADTENFLAGIVSVLLQPALIAQGGASLFGIVLLALFMAFAAFVVWLELVVREAAVYLTVAFLPLGFATYIWPALSSWLRRLIEVIVALVLSKLVIVVALSLAGSALAAQQGFGALVGGAGMLLLAAFAPFALFKLIPIASMATMSSLEGQGRRAARAATPRMSSAYYARNLAATFGGAHTGARVGARGAAATAGGSTGAGSTAAASSSAAAGSAAAVSPGRGRSSAGGTPVGGAPATGGQGRGSTGGGQSGPRPPRPTRPPAPPDSDGEGGR